MSLAQAFAPAEAAHRAQVLAATFGHLAPSIRKKYHGSILFTQSAYGSLVPIRADFPDLPDSPWFFEHLNDFVAERAREPGKVYRFDGTYMVFRNGSPSFSGKVIEVC
jgi:hypothetical protein